MTNEKKFNELLENKDFMQEIISMETLEEVQGGFAEQGVEVSKDEVEQLGEVIKEVNEKISKLSDDELNLIVGGSNIRTRLEKHRFGALDRMCTGVLAAAVIGIIGTKVYLWWAH